jgi:phage I-like protein
MSKPATQIPAHLVLALANSARAEEVAFGLALDLSLAFAGAEDRKAAPKWVPLLPAPDAKGEIVARDGRKWTLKDPAVVVAHFQQYGADIPLDLEHATHLLAPEGKPAPAQAWIQEMQVREDRSTWGRVEWTPAGLASWQSGGWKYVSPGILHDDAREIFGLASAGLVTRPALHLPALARSGSRNPTQKDETSMTTVALATLAAAAGLAASATEADVIAALSAGRQAQADLKDPTKFVPAADLAAAQTRASNAETALAAIQKDGAEKAAVALVDEAIAAGKLAPAAKAHWLDIAREAPEKFKAAVAAMPVTLEVSKTREKPDGQDGAKDENGLTADQLALCSQLSLDPKAFAANLPKETK